MAVKSFDDIKKEFPLTNNILSGQSFEGSMSESEKEIRRDYAEKHMVEVLKCLGYDIDNDPNMKDTPHRYIKVLMDEIGRGTYSKRPKITNFENNSGYDGIVFQGGITLRSQCSHHLAFIYGRCHVAYIVGENCKVIGLSKLNRIVDWIARRPQLQEQMCQQIHDELDKLLPGNRGIAVMIEAKHTCVSMRGIEDENSKMSTVKLSGDFLDNKDQSRTEFYNMIARMDQKF